MADNVAFVSGAGLAVAGQARGLQRSCLRAGRARAVRRTMRAVAIPVDGGGQSDPLAEVASTVTRYMNSERSRDVLEYALNFGTSVDRETPIESWRLLDVRKWGLIIEIMLCEKNDDKCVCIEEQIKWLDGAHVDSTDGLVAELSNLSKSCGLSGDI
eukprot:CAMPEP_0198336502 /NCGR_PEP_ID=MMETSP1450-20131203/21029_1 /TAXON_ID=753684 ORGANISM="Madagascaria erythrocladiodes, Strain CCMP3234" /NCGR_SAMPLE_ID=MMETSP1450 /ASSEMBLY_ACC=CAM_ASM_001115 /LENGTH=156 /DNA_ID=CAMNT_0044041245 /DNA_START=114 /DNA_END=584 /DNA_ORIENTATION=+